jgi:hypothetical protein
MAFTDAESRWFLGMLPEADGVFSAGDAGLFLQAYMYGSHISRSVGGTLTPSGAVVLRLELHKAFGGSLSPSGDLSRLLTAYRAFGGTISPTGDVSHIATFVMALGGVLGLSGAVGMANPSWLLIDASLRWMGEWDSLASYEVDDVVLYQSSAAAQWHVFISKIGHNVGNTPTSTAAAWRRLYQEPME